MWLELIVQCEPDVFLKSFSLKETDAWICQKSYWSADLKARLWYLHQSCVLVIGELIVNLWVTAGAAAGLEITGGGVWFSLGEQTATLTSHRTVLPPPSATSDIIHLFKVFGFIWTLFFLIAQTQKNHVYNIEPPSWLQTRTQTQNLFPDWQKVQQTRAGFNQLYVGDKHTGQARPGSAWLSLHQTCHLGVISAPKGLWPLTPTQGWLFTIQR